MASEQSERQGGMIAPGDAPLLGNESGHEHVWPGTAQTAKSPLLANVTVKVNAEASDELKAFIRAEVCKALDDLALATRTAAGIRTE